MISATGGDGDGQRQEGRGDRLRLTASPAAATVALPRG